MHWAFLLIFSIPLVFSQFLQCYDTSKSSFFPKKNPIPGSPSTDYKPQNSNIRRCVGNGFMCYKYVIKNEMQGFHKGSHFGCASPQVFYQRPGASAPKCTTKDKNVYCLCSGNLCNSVGGLTGALVTVFSLVVYFCQ